MKKNKIPEAIEAVENRKQYWLMDGRANHSIDDAIVLEVCDTEDEARDRAFAEGHYG